jgi:hypothetical protein
MLPDKILRTRQAFPGFCAAIHPGRAKADFRGPSYTPRLLQYEPGRAWKGLHNSPFRELMRLSSSRSMWTYRESSRSLNLMSFPQ